jgi:hypothetical protein
MKDAVFNWEAHQKLVRQPAYPHTLHRVCCFSRRVLFQRVRCFSGKSMWSGLMPLQQTRSKTTPTVRY